METSHYFLLSHKKVDYHISESNYGLEKDRAARHSTMHQRVENQLQ